ncbi:AAA family ATPase [Methylolobus aquaticus]
MKCSHCGTESHPGQRFCTGCGRELAAGAPGVCGRCGFANEITANFCGGCGLVLKTPPTRAAGAPEPRRLLSEVDQRKRQITAMFCDLVDSSGLATALDPEDYRSVLAAYQQACATAITEYDGYVAQYLGDGVLAYFGYPQVSEDDAQRAVCAAIRTIAAVSDVHPGHGLLLRVRVGLATGVVIVGRGGGMGDRVVVGEAPQLAARLQTLSGPNGIAIDAATRALLGPEFVSESLGLQGVKGFSQPVEAWRLADDQGVPEHLRRAPPSLAIPLVGRSQQRAVLTRCAARLHDGSGQIVLIRGEAGVGKSRLAKEALQWLGGRYNTFAIELCCSPAHTDSAYHPLIQCLNQLFFAGRRPPEALDAWSGICRLLAELALEDLAEVPPLFAQLLSVPLPSEAGQATRAPHVPERQQRLIQQSLLSLMLRRAGGKPLLLVIEDLQWADPSTLDFVAFVATQAASLPVLGLITAPADFNPAWFLQRNVTLIALERLDTADATAMAAAVAAPATLDPATIARVLARSGGLPLYIEEFTKALVAASARRDMTADDRIPEPGSLRDAVRSRLGSGAAVARLAAVLGYEFRLPVLAAAWSGAPDALAPGLTDLLQAGFVETRGPSSAGRYVFKHALIRDAVYGLLSPTERVAEHARIAGILERDFPELAASEPETLAQHFAGGDMAMRAVGCLEWAGRRAVELGGHAEAGVHFSHALRLLATLPESAERQRLELDLLVQAGVSLSMRSGYAAAEVEATYDRARELCRLRGDSAELYPVLRGLSAFYLVRSKLQTARELAEECVRLGKELQRVDYLIGSYDVLGYALVFAGELGAARSALLAGFDLFLTHDDGQFTYPTPQHPAIAYGCLLAVISWMAGDDNGATRYMRETLERAECSGRPFDQAYTHGFAALLETLRRNLAAAVDQANRVIELSQQHGFAVWLQAGTLYLAVAEGLRGGGSEAINLLITGLQGWRASGGEINRSFFLGHLAEIYRNNGMLGPAFDTIEEAVEHARHHNEHLYDALLFQLRGELRALSEPGDDEAAQADLMRAIEIAQGQGAVMFELRAATSLHKLCIARGCPEVSRAALESICEAVGHGSSGDMLADLHDARAQLGKTIF